MAKPIVIITGADTPTGLTTVRSLRDHSVECWGVVADRSAACCQSRYWTQIEVITGDPAGQIRSLAELGSMAMKRSGQKPLLLFSQDEWVLRASENRELLSECFRMVLPERGDLMRLMDKTMFHDWATLGGYPLPRSAIVSSGDEMREVADKLEPPFVVKPLVRTARWDAAYSNRKFITCSSKQNSYDLPGLSESLFDLSPRYIMQEWIAGDDEDVVFCLLCADETGKILDAFTGRKLWQWPPLTGSTAICTDFKSPELEALSKALMVDACLKGLGSVEFKFNRNDGRYLITEPTIGRNDYQSFVAVCAGHNLTGRLVESVFNLPVASKRQARGAVWIDEIAALRRVRAEKWGFLKLLKLMIRFSLVRKCFLFTDKRDLMPVRRRIRELL